MEWREKIISIAVIGTSRSIARREKWSAWNLPIRQRNIYDGLRGMDNKEEIFLDRTSLRSKRFRTSRTKSGSAEELFRIRAAWKIWREQKGRGRGVGEGKEGKGRSLPSMQVYMHKYIDKLNFSRVKWHLCSGDHKWFTFKASVKCICREVWKN